MSVPSHLLRPQFLSHDYSFSGVMKVRLKTLSSMCSLDPCHTVDVQPSGASTPNQFPTDHHLLSISRELTRDMSAGAKGVVWEDEQPRGLGSGT